MELFHMQAIQNPALYTNVPQIIADVKPA